MPTGYATQGWVFAAATINRDAVTKTNSRPHPLSFIFSTDKAVYPLRLTGVENDNCSIELFVFGHDRAETKGFQVEHCGRPFHIEESASQDFFSRREFFAPPDAGEYRIGNEEIRRLALPAAVATKLVATLRPDQMQSDAWIRWERYRPVVPTLYSSSAALTASLDWFVGIGVFGGLIVQLLAPRFSRRTCWRALLALIALAVTGGLTRLATAKVTEVEILRGGSMSAMNNLRILGGALEQYVLERKRSGALTFNELVGALNQNIRGGAKNTFRNVPLRNEATPGNVTLRQSTNGVNALWYDINGGAHVLATFDDAHR